jgi:hypothetical protein
MYYLYFFYIFLNAIRLNPFEYQNKMNISYICSPQYIQLLNIDWELQEESINHNLQLLDIECSQHISHNTCDKYCYQYSSCSYIDRIQYYCKDCINISENMIKGKKHPLKALHNFLELSMGHCQNIFDPTINRMGIGGNGQPWYIQTFAYKNVYPIYIESLCTYLWQNDTTIVFVCIGNSIDDIQLSIQCVNREEMIFLKPWLKKYIYYSFVSIHSTSFNYSVNGQLFSSLSERYYITI